MAATFRPFPWQIEGPQSAQVLRKSDPAPKTSGWATDEAQNDSGKLSAQLTSRLSSHAHTCVGDTARGSDLHPRRIYQILSPALSCSGGDKRPERA